MSDEQKLQFKKDMLKCWADILSKRGVISNDIVRKMKKEIDKLVV